MLEKIDTQQPQKQKKGINTDEGTYKASSISNKPIWQSSKQTTA